MEELSAIRQKNSFGNQFNFYILTPIEDENQEISHIMHSNDQSQIVILPYKQHFVDPSRETKLQQDGIKFRFIDKAGNNEFELEVKHDQKIQSLDEEINLRCKFKQHKVEYINAGRKIQPDETASEVFRRNRRQRPIYVFETNVKLENAKNPTKMTSPPTQSLQNEEILNDFNLQYKEMFGYESFVYLIPYTNGAFYEFKFEENIQFDEIFARLYNDCPYLTYDICILDKDSKPIDVSSQSREMNNQVLFYGRGDTDHNKLPEITEDLTDFIDQHQKCKELYDEIQEIFKEGGYELAEEILTDFNKLVGQLNDLKQDVEKFYVIGSNSKRSNQQSTQPTPKTSSDIKLNIIITNNSQTNSINISVPESSTFEDVTKILCNENHVLPNTKLIFKDSNQKDIFLNEKASKYANQDMYVSYVILASKEKTNQDSQISNDVSMVEFKYSDSSNPGIRIKSSETPENIEKQLYDYYNCVGPVKFKFTPDIRNGLKNVSEVTVEPSNGVHLFTEIHTTDPSVKDEDFTDYVLENNTRFIEIFKHLQRQNKIPYSEGDAVASWQQNIVTGKCPNDIGSGSLAMEPRIEILSHRLVAKLKEAYESHKEQQQIQQLQQPKISSEDVKTLMETLEVTQNVAESLLQKYRNVDDAIDGYLENQ